MCHGDCHMEFQSRHGLYQWISLIRDEERRKRYHQNQLVRIKTSLLSQPYVSYGGTCCQKDSDSALQKIYNWRCFIFIVHEVMLHVCQIPVLICVIYSLILVQAVKH